MFEEFKAAHAGLGPARFLLDQATGGALSFRAQKAAIGQQMDDTLAAVKADDLLPAEAKTQAAGLLAHGVYSAPEALKNIQTVQREAGIQHTIGETFAPMVEGAQKIFDDATTPEDKAIASTLLARAHGAQKLAQDPLTRQQGLDEYGKIQDATTAFETKSKEYSVNAAKDAEQRARDLDVQQNTRFVNTREDWQATSLPFRQVQSSARSLQELATVKVPNAYTDQLLMRAIGQIMNPGVNVRPGENPGDEYFNAMGEAGQLAKFVLTNNAGLEPEQRATAIAAATKRIQDENAAQMERNTAALKAGKAAGLPDKYLDQLTTAPIDLGPLAGYVAPPGAGVPRPTDPAGPPADPNAPQGETEAPITKLTKGVIKGVGGALIDLGTEAGRATGDAIRSAAGQPTNAETRTDASGAIYRLVDHGGGRKEWQLYKAAPGAGPTRNTDEIQVAGGF